MPPQKIHIQAYATRLGYSVRASDTRQTINICEGLFNYLLPYRLDTPDSYSILFVRRTYYITSYMAC